MKKLMFFGMSFTVVVFLIIAAGVVGLNPIDSFSDSRHGSWSCR